MKNAFYFILKALFVLKIFTLLSLLFDHVRKWRDKKAKFNFKNMTSLAGKQIITMHILSIISRSKTLRQLNMVS